MIDLSATAWESLAVIAGAFGLAVWALRDPQSERAEPAARSSAVAVARFRHASDRGSRIIDVESGAILGRAAECAGVIHDPTVSKHHARIEFARSASIHDLDSTNGTFVNGRRVTDAAQLHRGDRIGLGTAKLRFLGIVAKPSTTGKG
jgi:hypothetical protein